jgi:hypothetical protein
MGSVVCCVYVYARHPHVIICHHIHVYATLRSKQPSVDFQLDGKPYIYRIDFATMKERNLQMGRERGIRTLLSLLVRDSNGCAYQNNTIEINMPANTKLMALRKELANYLKHKEHLLRIMVGNRVLYRDETRYACACEQICVY